MATRASTGLRNGNTGKNSVASKQMTGIGISFGDGTGAGGNDQILDTAALFVTNNYQLGDYVTITGSVSNDQEGLKVLAVAAGALDVEAGSLTTETAGNQVILGVGKNGGSYDEMLRNGVIEVYSGVQPADPDAAETGTKLLRITVGSGAFVPGSAENGLNLAAPVAGVLSKEAAEAWSGVGLAAGTAGWFRFYSNAYVTGATTVGEHFDGVCGVGSGELRMSSLTVAVGATTTVDTGTITQPVS